MSFIGRERLRQTFENRKVNRVRKETKKKVELTGEVWIAASTLGGEQKYFEPYDVAEAVSSRRYVNSTGKGDISPADAMEALFSLARAGIVEVEWKPLHREDGVTIPIFRINPKSPRIG